MEKEIQSAIIGAAAGIIGAAIGAVGGWLAARSTNKLQQQIASDNAALQQKLAQDNARAQRQAYVDGLIMKMAEYRMEHPHLEKDEFCHSYPDMKGHANGKERYEAFCVFVFNALMAAFKHYDCDPVKLADYIGLEEIVYSHHKWWQHDIENLGYDQPFRQCIQNVIDELRKKGKIK